MRTDCPAAFSPTESRQAKKLADTGMSMAQPKMETSSKLPAETVSKLRTLAHDLSNSIETVMQASYLLAQVKLDADGKKWLQLIDTAARDAARINREIREILRSQS